MDYDDIATSWGWFKLTRGWYHALAEQYPGFVGYPVCYATAKELCEMENLTEVLPMTARTATIILPSGYATAEEFAKDCGFELAPARTLNDEAKEHPPYDNPCDPYASPDRMPPEFKG